MREFFSTVLRKLGVVSSDGDAAPSQAGYIQTASEHTALLISSASPIALNSAREELRDFFGKTNKAASLLFVIVLYSLTTAGGRDSGLGIAPLFLMYVAWCAPATLQKILSLVDDFQKAKESAKSQLLKLIIAYLNTIYYGVIYPTAIVWPLISAMVAFFESDHTEWFSTNRLLGSREAAVFNGAIFAGDLLLEASKRSYTLYRANQKSNPLTLLQDRDQKYQNALINPKISGEKKQRLCFELQALYIACLNHPELKDKTTNPNLNITIDARTACIEANYLLRKQEYKARSVRMGIVANLFGAIAAILGAFSTALDAEAKSFLWPSSMLYMLCWAIEYAQLLGPHCFGETKIPDPNQHIREIFELPENANIREIFSKKGVQELAAHPSLLTASSVGAFFVIPRTGTSSDGETTPPQRSDDNDTVSAASLLAATTTPPEIVSRQSSH